MGTRGKRDLVASEIHLFFLGSLRRGLRLGFRGRTPDSLHQAERRGLLRRRPTVGFPAIEPGQQGRGSFSGS